MKRFILLLAVIFSITVISENIYGKSGKEKDHDRGRSEKSEKDHDRDSSEKSEKNHSEKNQNALDAQRNWGQLKNGFEGDYEDEERQEALRNLFGTIGYEEETVDREYTDKELKEAIKAEKVVRRELRRNEDSLPEWATLERLVNDYLYGDDEHTEFIKEEYLCEVDDKSLEKMDRAKEKYNAALARLEENSEPDATIEE